jgi:hypothetical protein
MMNPRWLENAARASSLPRIGNSSGPVCWITAFIAFFRLIERWVALEFTGSLRKTPASISRIPKTELKK